MATFNGSEAAAEVPEKNSRIELCMIDKGFGGRQYQKTTLASNPKRDYTFCNAKNLLHFKSSWKKIQKGYIKLNYVVCLSDTGYH